jgi:DNA-binding NarL/FixJ family response regulator
VEAAVAGLAGSRPFVGRERELDELLGHLGSAQGGQGGVVLLAGEPGIGKTRLLLELANRARAQGGIVLFGRAYESDGVPPYLPFTEALRDYVRACPLDQLKSQLGDGGPEVALLVRDVRVHLPDLPESQSLGANEDRYRLFEAVSDFLLNIARCGALGVLLCLDDLHWADKPTLLLLQHLVRKLLPAPILIVGTYRTVEVDRTHPLFDMLAELSREHRYWRLVLASFTPEEAGTYITEIAGAAAAPSVVKAIYRETEGNPFFVGEVVRQLLSEGRDLASPSGAVEEWHVPEGARQVIGKRLLRLSTDANQLLQTGAVLGEGFGLDALGAISGVGGAAPVDGSLADALDEALRSGLLREEGQGYHFSHALVRQTVYGELNLLRRQQLHLQAAEGIERIHARNLEPHLAELAYHFSQAGAAVADKAVSYAARAGKRAQSVFAYEEAARFYEMALEALDGEDAPNVGRRCDLLLDLAEAQMALAEPRRVVEHLAPEALDLAEQHADAPRASRACLMALEALHRDAPRNTETPDWRIWAQRADGYAASGSPDRAYADVAMARAAIASGDRVQAIALLERALALARTLDDPELLFTCAWQAIYSELTPAHWRRSVALAAEFVARARDRVHSRTIGQILEMGGAALFAQGDLDGAEQAWRELGELAARTHDAFTQINAMSYEGLLALVDGRLEEAVDTARRIVARGGELGSPRLAAQFANGRCGRAFLYLGWVDELEAISGPNLNWPFKPQMAARRGRVAEARTLLWDGLQRYTFHDPSAVTERVEYLLMLLEAAVLIQDHDAAQLLAVWLADSPLVSPYGYVICIARQRGAAAALLGHRAEARRSYEQALEAATRLRFRPELALTHLQLAELLLDVARGVRREARGKEEQREALAHLDLAIDELQAMHMQPALEQALALRAGHARPPSPHPQPRFPNGLSTREVEVLRLIATGRSNQQIADGLVISLNTVIRHVSHIFAKTGVANRAEAAVYATRHGLA